MSGRLGGHELASEGAPYDSKKRRANGLYQGVGGKGRGLCSCGAMSDELKSGNQRKAWHREHKAEMRGSQP